MREKRVVRLPHTDFLLSLTTSVSVQVNVVL